MFGIGWPELIAAGALVAAAILGVRWGTKTQWMSVDDRWLLSVTPEEIERPLARMLAALPAARLRQTSAGTWSLTVTRSPSWTILPVIFLFPVGLLFLMVREQAEAQVITAEVAGGAEVRLLGTTRASVRTTLSEALAGLPTPAH